jgi:hypothetical protein
MERGFRVIQLTIQRAVSCGRVAFLRRTPPLDAGGLVADWTKAPSHDRIAALLAAVVDREVVKTRAPEPELDLDELARELADLRERDPAAARERAKRFLDG